MCSRIFALFFLAIKCSCFFSEEVSLLSQWQLLCLLSLCVQVLKVSTLDTFVTYHWGMLALPGVSGVVASLIELDVIFSPLVLKESNLETFTISATVFSSSVTMCVITRSTKMFKQRCFDRIPTRNNPAYKDSFSPFSKINKKLKFNGLVVLFLCMHLHAPKLCYLILSWKLCKISKWTRERWCNL